jgi:hypothetical protein
VELLNDYVFILIGGESPEEFLRKTGIAIVEKSLSVAALSETQATHNPITLPR